MHRAVGENGVDACGVGRTEEIVRARDAGAVEIIRGYTVRRRRLQAKANGVPTPTAPVAGIVAPASALTLRQDNVLIPREEGIGRAVADRGDGDRRLIVLHDRAVMR